MRSRRPTVVPVTLPPRSVVLCPTLAGALPSPSCMYWVPVSCRCAPASSPVTLSERPTLLPVTPLPLRVSLREPFAGPASLRVPQNASAWSAPRYSVPVTRLQVPGSSPVTCLLRPTSLPVTALPRAVGLTPTRSVPLPGSAWQNSRKISAPMYSVPVTGRQVLGSSPVTLWLRPTIVPVTVCPCVVSLAPTFHGASCAAAAGLLRAGRCRPVGSDFFCPALPRLLRWSRSTRASSRPDRSGLVARAVCAAVMPEALIPALPRVDCARRRASEAERPGLATAAGRLALRTLLRPFDRATVPGDASLPRRSPLQPQPQSPAFAVEACSEGFTAFAAAACSALRTRSVLDTATLPRVDIALRRASEAARPPAPADGRAAEEARGVAAVVGSCTFDGRGAAPADAAAVKAALPEPDMARRRAKASCRPLKPCALPRCVMLPPVCHYLLPTPSGPSYPSCPRAQVRPSYTTKATPWLCV